MFNMGDFNRFERRRSGRDSFDRNRPRFGGRDRGRDRRSDRQEMHSVICDKCGKECEVPFKPTQGKPIFCDECFRDRSREAGSRSEMGKPIDNEKFDHINKKLDKILKLLEGKKEPVEDQPESKKPKKIEKEEPKLEYAKNIEKEQQEVKKVKKKKAKKKKT